jgi:hypothetical protein
MFSRVACENQPGIPVAHPDSVIVARSGLDDPIGGSPRPSRRSLAIRLILTRVVPHASDPDPV